MSSRAALAVGLVGAAVLLPAAAALAHDKHVMVDIKGYKYAPVQPVTHVGDTVMWTNQDSAPHDVTSVSGPTTLDSPELRKGETWSFTATKAGTYRYYCSLHPEMKAGLVVEPAAAAAVTPSAAPSRPAGVPSATRSPAAAPPPAAAAPMASRPAAAARVQTSAPTATPAPSQTPISPPPVVRAVAPAAQEETLDPDLLLVALGCGAVLTCLLVLGRRATT